MKILVIVLIFIYLNNPSPIFAQENQSTTPTPSPLPEYTLPYPGILPDSPLYFLKVSRDRIVSFLIADPLKKAEFSLLQADKRLGAGLGLVEKKNYALAESTLSKGLNYFEEALVKVEEAKKSGRDVKPILERITLSAEKHRVSYKDFEKENNNDFQKHVDTFLERIEKYQKKVKELTPQE